MLTQLTRRILHVTGEEFSYLLGMVCILAPKSRCLAFMHDASWNAIVAPQHTDFASCLSAGRKHELCMTVYTLLHSRKGFKSIKCFIWFSHIFWHMIQKCQFYS